MKITVNDKGVFVGGVKVDKVTRVDVINLNPMDDMEVVLHIAASEIEVDYRTLAIKE